MSRKTIIFVFLAMIVLLASVALAGCGGTAPIEDIRWLLTSYGDPDNPKTLVVDTQPTVQFSSDTGEVSGSGGCNSFFGEYEIDGDNLEMKGPFAVTEMWCGEETGQQESDFLYIFLSAETYEINGNALTIYCGNNVLNFLEE